MDKAIDLSSSATCFEGVYSSDNNKVSLHVDHYYFEHNLTYEDLDILIENLKKLQELII